MKNYGGEGDGKKFNKLIKRIAANESGALEQFYALYGKLIYAAALTVVNAHYADEVVDEVLVKIWQGAKSFGKIKKPVSWLYTIAVNCAKDKRRAVKDYSQIFDIPEEDGSINAVENEDSFYSYISALDGEEQQIMIYRFVEDMSFKQIAGELNKPLNTVTSIYYRALKKIKQKLN